MQEKLGIPATSKDTTRAAMNSAAIHGTATHGAATRGAVSDGVKKNQSLRKALAILEGMTRISTPARLQDISRNLKIPQSTLLRFLNTFIDFDYVRQDPATSCYYLTMKLADLGARTKDNFPFQNSLAKYIKQISRRFNEASSLCVERDMRMVYIAIEEGPDRMLQTLNRIGHIAPMHATGVGKLHLLNYTEARLEELEQRYAFTRFTEHTITTLESLKQELAHVRQDGYALDNEECEYGVRCVAVPIKDAAGQVVAAMSLSAPLARLDKERTNEVIAFLKEVSVQASRETGFGSL